MGGCQIRSESARKSWTIPSGLTVAVVPLSVVTVLLGMYLVRNLVTTDPTAGFSWVDAGAVGLSVVVVVAVAGTLVGVYRRGRSIARRVGEVSAASRRVADKDLVDLLDALRNPDTDLDSITPMSLDTATDDEVGDLARSFEELHGSLVEVGARQMETMRAGVSSIFVTLARRNSSLVDRQLALLDELEAKEENPEVLGGFYQLDHLAARMRRNAESLLVLAGSESPRVWAKATEMSDVVRAAVSEIDEYQRIEVLALEPARLSGGAVSDVSHLVAELLENAIQFSPPSEMIRVTGLFDMNGYQLSVSDRGVGMSDARIAEMNRILSRPPALGLSVEPTLGMYVVAKLANRHGLDVELIRGVPGITAKITIPRDHLEVDDQEPFDGDHTRRIPSVQEEAGSSVVYADAETREYVRSRSEDRPSPVPASSKEVVDLTLPEYDSQVEHIRELPKRKPGLSFSESSDGADAVSAGDVPSHIRSALSAYDEGRRSASDSGEANPGSSTDEPDSEDRP